MILVDSSVWVDVLRDQTGGRRDRLLQILGDNEIVFCRITEIELLCGARDEVEWSLLSDYLGSQQYLETESTTWAQAVRIYYELRRQGVTVRSLMDCIIAQIAIDHQVLLLHRDQDFAHIANIRPLQQMAVEW